MNLTKKADHVGAALAAIAAVAVVAAVIAGFLAVGGPDEARAKRLDAAQLQDIAQIASMAQCAFGVDGKAPATQAELRVARLRSGTGYSPCEQLRRMNAPDFTSVSYRALSSDRVELCTTFLTTITQDDLTTYPVLAINDFPELSAPHPTGHHCYAIQLHKQQEQRGAQPSDFLTEQ